MRGGNGYSKKRFEIGSSKPTNAFLLVSFTILAFTVLFTIITVPQDSYALSLSKTFAVPGTYTITFRDVSSVSPTPDPVISFDKASYFFGDTGTLTITDFNGNVDPFGVDTIFATVNSVDIPLTETGGVNSGIFSGPFVADASTDVVYNPQPPDSIRALLHITVITPDTEVTITDYTLEAGTCVGDGYLATEGITVSSTEAFTLDDISISFANAVMTLPEIEWPNLRIYHDPDPLMTVPANFVTNIFGEHVFSHDFDTDENGDGVMMAVTADATTASESAIAAGVILLPPNTGNYILNVAGAGCGGGVGGGIAAGGIVLNFLAGTLLSGGGLDRTPPSLTSTISSGVQFDPFTPIEPTGGSLADTTAQPPLRINQNGYNLYGYSNTIVTNTVETGQFTDMSLAFNEASKVEHVAMYFVDPDRAEHSDTDPALIFDKGNIIKVDPQGIFGDDIQMSTSKEGTKSIFNFGMSFDKPTNKHIIIVAWDDKRNAGTTKVFNALAVVGNEIPNEVAHFMPIEQAGEFDLIKGDNGQYVLSQPAQTETVTDLPQTIAYPQFIGRLERHDAASLHDVINQEQQKAADIISSKMNVDNNLFSINQDTKLIDHSKRAPQLTSCGKYLGCELDRENTDVMKTLMWQEHLKAEKILASLIKSHRHY